MAITHYLANQPHTHTPAHCVEVLHSEVIIADFWCSVAFAVAVSTIGVLNVL